MARTANYEQKIESITAKIKKRTEELKALNEYLVNKGITPEEALGKLKETYGE